MRTFDRPLAARQIEEAVAQLLPAASASSVRSYLRLNTPGLFVRESRGMYRLRSTGMPRSAGPMGQSETEWCFGRVSLWRTDCFEWLEARPERSIHAVVTDPPYGLHEYTADQQQKLRAGKGGVWRIPPSFDGHERSPLPRFTTLTEEQLKDLWSFFHLWGRAILPRLVPGANVLVASNPLLCHIVGSALSQAGLERRGEIIRLVTTMRGGDRPKGAHREFAQVSVMPRSMWEPWLMYRKPLEGRVKDNLRKWKTGGYRRPSEAKPFGDVIKSSPTTKKERDLAPHPSLKPQAFLRKIVHAVLPLGEGTILDPFAGSGSTLAAAEAVGYEALGVEKDAHYFHMACEAIPRLAALRTEGQPSNLYTQLALSF
ncbi:MAG TPA: site-specific DNA-methyltransferase [Phycisphaerales bacterium]|nr:site-specific DNA-methyltransferase [Phycisphaerales bacterium]